ncbi:actin-like protein [Trypanosoma brucei equiperdum]|uniref:Actin-like protein n=1 Tax=Trypanosoma brucei equiperdum TaxID=630700 RepID=A0A3L6L0I0_9TRYP|nr:actin-like protein [Trypanosoma brucei equiperdum]
MTAGYPVLVVDNGGYMLKALYITSDGKSSFLRGKISVIPNCVGAASYVGRGIVGEQLFKLPHFHGFMVRRPVDRGFIVDAGLQSYIWEYLLQHLAVADESEVELVMTVPFGAPKQVGELLHYLVAQRFRFRSVTFVSSSFLTLVSSVSRDWLYGKAPGNGKSNKKVREKSNFGSDGVGSESVTGCGMVVDFGFSSTTVVPYVNFIPLQDSIVRIDVGGKLLSNRLKELISFTQVNVTEDGWLVNHIMEQACYVALDPLVSLRKAEYAKRFDKGNGAFAGLRYYLPTVPPLMPLGCREEQLTQIIGKDVVLQEKNSLQHIVFRHEAFLIPELIFNPVDVGICQMGVVEAIVHGTCCRGSLQNMRTLHGAMMRRIIAFGGITKFKNLPERLSTELRKHLKEEGASRVSVPPVKGSAPLQEFVQWSRIGRVRIDLQYNGVGYTPSDCELQPLFGALALITCPVLEPQLKLVQSRSRVELLPGSTAKGSQNRQQASAGPRTLSAVLSALQNLL